jgi:hypothetical protein
MAAWRATTTNKMQKKECSKHSRGGRSPARGDVNGMEISSGTSVLG